jgi:hypothetical protein
MATVSTDADEMVARFILRDFREEVDRYSPPAERHLAKCPDARAAHIEGEDGTYGCGTGCEYARLTAQISCPHGHQVEHEYGEFGEIGDLLEDIQREESRP